MHSPSHVAHHSFITQPPHSCLPSISLKYPHNRHVNSPNNAGKQSTYATLSACRSGRRAYCCRCCCYFYARKCWQCFQLARVLGAYLLLSGYFVWRCLFCCLTDMWANVQCWCPLFSSSQICSLPRCITRLPHPFLLFLFCIFFSAFLCTPRCRGAASDRIEVWLSQR